MFKELLISLITSLITGVILIAGTMLIFPASNEEPSLVFQLSLITIYCITWCIVELGLLKAWKLI